MLLHFADFRASIRVQSVSTLESHRLHLSLGEFVDTLDVVDRLRPWRGVDQAAEPWRRCWRLLVGTAPSRLLSANALVSLDRQRADVLLENCSTHLSLTLLRLYCFTGFR
jgi:hypothetical protein